jgi:hypothetical protein
VDTEAKKIASFKRGLGPKLMKTMGTSKCATFNDFISDALTQENNNSIYATNQVIGLGIVHILRRIPIKVVIRGMFITIVLKKFHLVR